ncbi:MAG: hypothetical protein QGI18_05850 [Candidatus Marinimicrobia bacterium]|jgi:hypothetical protein|nr:hypothetical protein [Candidatus Neomarinimicrobiota bacterium]
MAYQDWYTAASINAQGPSGALPPALVPASNSVLEEQSDPGGYTSSNPTVFNATSPSNTPVSSTNQISQIMNSVNPSPLSEPQAQGTAGMGYGSAPMSWNQMSTGGPTGPSAPSISSTNPGVTHNYGNSALYDAFGTDSEGIAAANSMSNIISSGRRENPAYNPSAIWGTGLNAVINSAANTNPAFGLAKDVFDALGVNTNVNVRGESNRYLRPGWSPPEMEGVEYGNQFDMNNSEGISKSLGSMLNQDLGIDTDWWKEVMDQGKVSVTDDSDWILENSQPASGNVSAGSALV